ncbi:Arginase/deacetylase [Delitschia confertaspora ATCC 74209]|uniref:histone deacetylase n=1 Tax=Delitschia confertaspora ATCC 74209 TaxID=1513339 RepID=A0A9P4MRC0_9PLEO|nr:Arginase/deacetylase [Delitschia confertaspora ATCC 74209]
MEEDYQMIDEDVVDTTEVNGNNGTVDPSVITLDGSVQSGLPIRKEPPLAFNQPPLVHPPQQMSYEILGKDLTADYGGFASSSSSAEHYAQEDELMDVEDSSSPPARAPSPYVEIIKQEPRFPPLPYASGKTGLVYDAQMRFHVEPPNAYLPEDIHPEDPRRIWAIFDEIRKAGLVQGPEEDEDAKDYQCCRISARHATRPEICLIHTEDHYNFIKKLQDYDQKTLSELAGERDSIYFHHYTFNAATLAAGGAIEACRAVVMGSVRNAIAIIRPPGHHAESDAPSGFCIFNNVPIATEVCRTQFQNTCRKVLILDWDVHHGNGIQHAFYDNPNVLYVSLHVYKDATFYPNSTDADHLHCGEGPGLGKNVNIPWKDHGMGDGDYIHAFTEVIMPIAQEFDPDLVIISAGFDAADGDMLGGCHVSPAGYAHMTHMLMRLAGGKVVVCLEGGYNLRSIAKSALAVTKTLMMEPPERLEDSEVSSKGAEVVQMVKREQRKYWKCLYPKAADLIPGATHRLHDVLRNWQSGVLRQEYNMTDLLIKKRFISASFEDQVLATPYFMDAHPLLVIFHDPPDVTHIPNATSGKLEIHNTWVTDITKTYIDWAVKNGFQVIDVNIPKYVTKQEDDGQYVEVDDHDTRASQSRELATYIWENYIEPHNATQVFFMGIGAAYTALVDLLGATESCTEPDSIVKYMIAFVSESGVQSIKRATDDNIGNWYFNHSLIFVAENHHVWAPERTRRLRRKYGQLRKSSSTHLEQMLLIHRKQVTDLLLAEKEAWEETSDDSRGVEEYQYTRSPPRPRSTITPNAQQESKTSREMSASAPLKSPPLRSPQMPPLGLFTVSHSRSPDKRGY